MSYAQSTILYSLSPTTITKLSIRNTQKDCQIASTFYNGNEIEVIKKINRYQPPISEYQG
jgi:hypothetical protein